MTIYDMDLVNILRSAVTVCAFASFIGIVFWAWSGARKAEFDMAARMPLNEEEDQLMLDGSRESARVERSGK